MGIKKKYKIIGSCIGCKTCYRVCPVGAVGIGPFRIDQEKCIGCGLCREKCPSKRIIEMIIST